MITFAFLNCHASLGNCSFTSLKIELSCGIYHQQSLPPLVWCSRADRNLRGWRPCLAEAGCMRGKRSESVSALTCMSRCCLCVHIVTSLRQRRGLPKRHAGPRAPPKLAPRQDSNEGDLQNTCRQASNILGVFSIRQGYKFNT